MTTSTDVVGGGTVRRGTRHGKESFERFVGQVRGKVRGRAEGLVLPEGSGLRDRTVFSGKV